jgi:hypothetical protein
LPGESPRLEIASNCAKNNMEVCIHLPAPTHIHARDSHPCNNRR